VKQLGKHTMHAMQSLEIVKLRNFCVKLDLRVQGALAYVFQATFLENHLCYLA